MRTFSDCLEDTPPPLLCLHDWIYSPLLWKGPRGSKAITVVKHSCQWNIVFHRGEPMVFRITRQRSLENKKTNNLAWKAFLKSTKLLILSTLPRTLLGVMDAKAWRVSFWVIYMLLQSSSNSPSVQDLHQQINNAINKWTLYGTCEYIGLF